MTRVALMHRGGKCCRNIKDRAGRCSFGKPSVAFETRKPVPSPRLNRPEQPGILPPDTSSPWQVHLHLLSILRASRAERGRPDPQIKRPSRQHGLPWLRHAGMLREPCRSVGRVSDQIASATTGAAARHRRLPSPSKSGFQANRRIVARLQSSDDRGMIETMLAETFEHGISGIRCAGDEQPAAGLRIAQQCPILGR